jgi:hypothetical protein
MGYRINIRGSSTSWDNLLSDTHVEVTDTSNNFTSNSLDGVLDELHTLASSASGLSWNSIITDTTATANNGYFVNTSAGEVTVTLPAAAAIGDTIKVSDTTGSFATYNCIIDRNGHKIMGLSEDFTCDIDNLCIELIYSNVTNGWKITDFTF